MMKIKVWHKNAKTNEEGCRVLRNLKPRRYMTSWSFNQLINYVKEELYWEDIEKDSVVEIVIFNEREQWQQVITRA